MVEHYEQLKEGAPIFDVYAEEKNTVYGFQDMLEWDEFHRRYYLTVDAVDNELNVDLVTARGDYANAKSFLKEISELVYAYLYKKKTGIRREKLEYFLTFDLRNRRILYIAMIDMLRYAFYSGGNVIGYQPGVNLNESQQISMEDLRDERIVSYVTDSVLKTNRLIDRDFVERFSVPDDFKWE